MLNKRFEEALEAFRKQLVLNQIMQRHTSLGWVIVGSGNMT